MKRIVSLVAASFLVAPAAFAGGYVAPVVEPTIAPVVMPVAGRDWTGFYGGVQLGYGDASTDNIDFSADGSFGGVHLGYLKDYGKWVLGGELAYSAADISDSGGFGKIDSMTQLKLLAGAGLGDWLLYGTAGIERMNVSVGGTDFADNVPFGGIGAAWAMNDSWMLGGEVLYHKANDFDNTGVDGDMTTLALKASLRF
ncbi:MAG: outer membrane beta-barrel protein [Paracoccaceae bacterium]|nr:outer membrane beta-barrel protein [Paracoccaceae bacterium]